MRTLLNRSFWNIPVVAFGSVALMTNSAAVAAGSCTKVFKKNANETTVSWHDDSNWKPAGAPEPHDVACFTKKGDYTVKVDKPVTVAGLLIDVSGERSPKIKIVGADFTLNGDGYLAGDTVLRVKNGGVLRSDTGGVIEVHSKLVVDGGRIEMDIDLFGRLNWFGNGEVTGALHDHAGSVIKSEGVGTASHLIVEEGFDLNGNLVFDDSVDQSVTVTSGSLVIGPSGAISTESGTGEARSTPSIQASIVNNGLIDLNGVNLRVNCEHGQHVNGIDGRIEVTGGELTIDLSGGSGEFVPNFTNYGSGAAAGAADLRIVNSGSERGGTATVMNFGTFTVSEGASMQVIGSALTFVNAGVLDVESGGLFTVTEAGFSNQSSGSVRGSGTLDLTEAAGAVSDGTISPGLSTGILTVDGDLGQGPTSALVFEIGGESPGVNLDRLDVTQSITAGGSLNAYLLGNYKPREGERFEVLRYGALNGWFSQVSLPQLKKKLDWNLAVGPESLVLEVVCAGTRLGIEQTTEDNTVSIGHEVTYGVMVRNHSTIEATELQVTSILPPELIFRQESSSPECTLIGSTVECSLAALPSSAAWPLTIAVEPVMAGTFNTTVSVKAWECDDGGADDHSTVTIEVVAAEPCDANYDLAVDSDDLVPAVGHIYGEPALGNPDCRPTGGVTADDLAAIIETSE